MPLSPLHVGVLAPVNHFFPGKVSNISFVLVTLWIDAQSIEGWDRHPNPQIAMKPGQAPESQGQAPQTPGTAQSRLTPLRQINRLATTSPGAEAGTGTLNEGGTVIACACGFRLRCWHMRTISLKHENF